MPLEHDKPQLEGPVQTSDCLPELQQQVQRWLGRCLLRIQQYELLTKALVAHAHVAGPAKELTDILARQVQASGKATLGTLVDGKGTIFQTLKASLVTGERPPALPEDDQLPSDQISFGFRFHIQMSDEDRLATSKALDDFVDLRNRLVHHFIEDFDISAMRGCEEALLHLQSSHQTIGQQFESLLCWAENLDSARTEMASYMRSPEYKDFVINGIAPDGTVDWAAAGIVPVLRESHRTLAVDGWALLDDAIQMVERLHPNQTPQKYHCRTWPQVLNDSKAFSLQYRTNSLGKKLTWFAPR